MTAQFTRVRAISVRMSEQEYLALERLYSSSNARSMSELVRQAVQHLLGGENQENAIAATVHEHSLHVKDLTKKMEKLAAEIEVLKAAAQGHSLDAADAANEENCSNIAADHDLLPDEGS